MGDKERHSRKFQEDGRGRTINYMVFLGWFILLVALVLFMLAATPAGDSFYRDSGARLGETGSGSTMPYAVLMFAFLGGLSIWGGMLNLSRMKRKLDRFHYSFVVQGVLSVAGIIYFIVTR